ncbi:MatE [anaerobic digester metagenome]
MFIPKIYELLNIFWIGHISTEALAITEQYQFVSITIEIINETIPFGILALVARYYHDLNKVIEIIKAGLLLQILFSVFLASIVIFLPDIFVSTIGTPIEIVKETSNYLILKSVALPFEAIAYLFLIAIKSLQKGKEALILVTISVILNVILDLILISNTSISLNMGIQGVAIGYVISKMLLMGISTVYFFKLVHLDLISFFKAKWKEQIYPLFAIGIWTGLDSLVRNAGYMGLLLVLNTMGVSEFGGYGLAMAVMWTLLIPVLALGEGTSIVIGNYFGEKKFNDIINVVKTSLLLVTIIMLIIAIIGIFWWDDMSTFFNTNPEMVQISVETFSWLIIPYIGFGIGTIFRSIFIGTGQTRYIFYIACIVNIGLILPFVTLVKSGIIPASFTSVMMFYMISFLLDPILAFVWSRKVIKNLF